MNNHTSSPAGNGEENVRIKALEEARNRSDRDSLRLIEESLGHASWRVRKTAAEAARAFPDPAAVSRLLIKSLGDEDNAGRRTAAMEALVAMGRPAVPHLIASLKDKDEEVRKFVVDILGQIRDPQSVIPILALMSDPSENIRLATIETLGSIGGDKAFEALLSLLSAEDVSIQFGVLYALGKIGKPIPMERIKPLAGKKILQRAVYDALGQTKNADAIEILIDGLLDAQKSAKQSALKSLHLLSAVPGLDKAVEAHLKRRLSGASLDSIGEFLESPNLPTKKAAVALLSLLGTPEAIRALVKASDDDTLKDEIGNTLASLHTARPDLIGPGGIKARSEEAREVRKLIRETPAPAKTLGPMSQEEFLEVRDIVARESGLHYDNELKYLVERRVQRRMEVTGTSGYRRYLELLREPGARGAAELRELINSLSTNETYFFREDFQLKAFQEEIFPALLEGRKSSDPPIRIWSAGSSSGEEAYTIAILVSEKMGKGKPPVEILGSDINDKMVAMAQKAVYSPASFRATPPDYLKKYFTSEGAKMRLHDEIRQMASFDTTNLMECAAATHLKNLDVIFCRNVIIYFSAEAKRRVVENFFSLLKPGGYLLLGHSESLMSVSTHFELVHLKNDLVYRKPLGRRP